MAAGLRSVGGNPAAPPYSNGPYEWDQHVTFSQGINGEGDTWYVDGTNGATGNNGKSWSTAFSTVQLAVTAAGPGDTIFVTAKAITDTTGDPNSYAETIIIPETATSLSIIGVSRGRTQGGLPQIKMGSGSTALLTIRASGCLIQNIGINGSGSTGGGILLDDDYSAKHAFATTIDRCHIKNCVGSTATSAKTGGGIMWSAQGNAWQCSITNNMFYKNVGDIVLLGTSNTRPQDILIQGNVFRSSVTSSCDANIVDAGQGGFQTIAILDNHFGDLPALGSGAVLRYIDITGTQEGMLHGNTFGAVVDAAGTEVTFGASGTAALIPTTVTIVNNWGVCSSATAGHTGYIYIT